MKRHSCGGVSYIKEIGHGMMTQALREDQDFIMPPVMVWWKLQMANREGG